MSLLSHFLKLLQGLETALEFLAFLGTPIGTIAMVGLSGYAGLQWMGCDAPTASTLAGSVALALSCMLTTPRS